MNGSRAGHTLLVLWGHTVKQGLAGRNLIRSSYQCVDLGCIIQGFLEETYITVYFVLIVIVSETPSIQVLKIKRDHRETTIHWYGCGMAVFCAGMRHHSIAEVTTVSQCMQIYAVVVWQKKH